MSSPSRRVWFITGASRGFGLEIARVALDRGDAVVGTARDPRVVEEALPGHGDDLLALALDVTSEDQARAAVDAAVERFGRIDVLVNNAGRGLLGAVEEATDADVRSVYETNVFGLLAVTRAALPQLRRQQGGRIVNMSSMGGFSQGFGWGVYGSTKFAVEGLSEALGAELAPLGIGVTIVEPGAFRTDFLDGSSLHLAARTIDDYADTVGRMRGWAATSNGAQPGDPVKAAVAIVDAVTGPEPPTRLQLGADAVTRVEQKLAHVAAETERWREVALSTAHDDVPARS